MAPVGSPFGLFSSGSAWNARYRYDEPSTSNKVFSGSIPDMTNAKLVKPAGLGHGGPPSRYQNISLRFKHFFARKVMFVRFATAFVVLPGGYGTLDELFEALTLVQTGKTRQMPIILVHEPFWRGLLGWMKERLAAEGMIDETDLGLVQVCNKPQEVVDVIFAFDEKRGFQPLPAERQ